jgi:hypothetical protein
LRPGSIKVMLKTWQAAELAPAAQAGNSFAADEANDGILGQQTGHVAECLDRRFTQLGSLRRKLGTQSPGTMS